MVQEYEELSSRRSGETRDPVDLAIMRLRAAMVPQKVGDGTVIDPTSFYNLVNDIIQKTEEIRASRSKTWSETIQKATLRGGDTGSGLSPSFSVADALTDIPDERLATALNRIADLMENPDYIDLESLDQLKAFADKLPSSRYKASIDTIYRSCLFCGLAMLTLVFPLIAPMTMPLLVPLCFVAGSVIMGMACHFSLKAFINHTAEEVFENERFAILRKIHEMDSGVSDQKVEAGVIEGAKKVLAEIEQGKKQGTLSASEASKALKIIRQSLDGDPKALEKLNNLQENIKFSSIKDAVGLLKDGVTVAYKKYPLFAAFVGLVACVQIAAVAVSPTFLIHLVASFFIGALAIAGYESTQKIRDQHRQVDQTKETRPQKSHHALGDSSSDPFQKAQQALSQLRSERAQNVGTQQQKPKEEKDPDAPPSPIGGR